VASATDWGTSTTVTIRIFSARLSHDHYLT
jgi:hypothetical protein